MEGTPWGEVVGGSRGRQAAHEKREKLLAAVF